MSPNQWHDVSKMRNQKWTLKLAQIDYVKFTEKQKSHPKVAFEY
jgi:hypothetical protein